MRSKEEAHDYRYFPDPDLLPLELTQDYVDGLKKGLPELPDAKRARFMKDYGLSAYDAGVLTAERESAEFFEAVAKGRDGKIAANWVINELFGRLNKEGLDIEHSPVSAAQLGGIIDLIASGAISGKIAKDVFEIVWSEGGDPAEIVEKRGLKQVTDTGAIEKAVDAIIAANPDKVADAKANPKAIGWFVGQVMKATGGKANPQAVNEVLKKKLGLAVKTKATGLYPFVPSGADFKLATRLLRRARLRARRGSTTASPACAGGGAYFMLPGASTCRKWQKNQMLTIEVEDLDAYWAELELKDLPARFAGREAEAAHRLPVGPGESTSSIRAACAGTLRQAAEACRDFGQPPVC